MVMMGGFHQSPDSVKFMVTNKKMKHLDFSFWPSAEEDAQDRGMIDGQLLQLAASVKHKSVG